jgi:hypothetical protein
MAGMSKLQLYVVYPNFWPENNLPSTHTHQLIYSTRSTFPAYIILNVLVFLTLKTAKLCCLSQRANYTERPLIVGEDSANFCGKSVSRGQRDGSLLLYSRFSGPGPLIFLFSSSSAVLTRLSGPCFRPVTSQKME